MTNTELFELISCFDRSTVQSLKLSTQDFTIELARGQGSAPASAQDMPVQSAATPASQQPTVAAPLVGTFYTAPAPDQPPLCFGG